MTIVSHVHLWNTLFQASHVSLWDANISRLVQAILFVLPAEKINSRAKQFNIKWYCLHIITTIVDTEVFPYFHSTDFRLRQAYAYFMRLGPFPACSWLYVGMVWGRMNDHGYNIPKRWKTLHTLNLIRRSYLFRISWTMHLRAWPSASRCKAKISNDQSSAVWGKKIKTLD